VALTKVDLVDEDGRSWSPMTFALSERHFMEGPDVPVSALTGGASRLLTALESGRRQIVKRAMPVIQAARRRDIQYEGLER